MVTVVDREGNPVAKYGNLSEAVTYWQHSAGEGGPRFDKGVRENELTVFNKDGEEVGAIKIPRGEPSDADRRTMERLFPPDSPNDGNGRSGDVSGG
jgi:hypothetical protein